VLAFNAKSVEREFVKSEEKVEQICFITFSLALCCDDDECDDF
jgi:hypothetical protein